MTIKAVLFDFDDTLIDVTASREERALRAYTRLRAEAVRVSWRPFWHTINSMDADGFYRRGMEGAIDDLDLDGSVLGHECIGLWRFAGAEDLLTPSVGCTDLLELLSERYRLGVVTNGPEDSQKHKFAHCGLQSYFELFLPSGEAGVQKPDPRILQIALERLSLAPREAVFVGDHIDLDVICAQDAGMRGIWYNPRHHGRSMHPYITPDAMIRRLEELPGVIERFERA